MKKMLFLLFVFASLGNAVAQTITQSELEKNTANLTPGANYNEVAKTDPVMVALAKDVLDGSWTNVPGYQVRSPGKASFADMDLSRFRNKTFKYNGVSGTFLRDNNFGHYIITRLSDGFSGPAGCLNPLNSPLIPFSVVPDEYVVVEENSNKNQDNRLYYESGDKDFDTGVRYTPKGLGNNTVVYRVEPTGLTGNLVTDAKNIPVQNNYQRPVYLTSCQMMWAEKYPEAYSLWLQTDSRSAFNEWTIPYGPDRRKARRCFEGPSAGRVILGILGGAAIATGGYYGVKALADGGDGNDDPFDPNTPEDDDPGDYNPGDDVGLIFNRESSDSYWNYSGNSNFGGSSGGIRINLFGGGG